MHIIVYTWYIIFNIALIMAPKHNAFMNEATFVLRMHPEVFNEASIMVESMLYFIQGYA